MPASITRRTPPMVEQTLTDSCWAASLQSWSRADGRIPNQDQQALIARYGEGATGAITPTVKIPQIAASLNLRQGAFRRQDLVPYLQSHLGNSHVFCAYTVGEFTHAVVIYRLSERDNISYMDPNGGRDRSNSVAWFKDREPFVMMRVP
ncbi:MAG TPA: papain-like cysteine protease family protein [Caulobacteraceae bacterium]|jgi:hypothetical protein